jgi:hypothetical protein
MAVAVDMAQPYIRCMRSTCGGRPADARPDRAAAQALVCGPAVAAVEAPELAVDLKDVDGLLLTFGGD